MHTHVSKTWVIKIDTDTLVNLSGQILLISVLISRPARRPGNLRFELAFSTLLSAFNDASEVYVSSLRYPSDVPTIAM